MSRRLNAIDAEQAAESERGKRQREEKGKKYALDISMSGKCC